ncbi:MAG: hypothetical protein ABSB34_00440 [Candidatus Limnocylindrales bacterium]
MNVSADATSLLRRLAKPGSWLNLRFTDIFRSEAVITAVAIGQTLGFAALFGTWLVVAFGPLVRTQRAQAAEAEPTAA